MEASAQVPATQPILLALALVGALSLGVGAILTALGASAALYCRWLFSDPLRDWEAVLRNTPWPIVRLITQVYRLLEVAPNYIIPAPQRALDIISSFMRSQVVIGLVELGVFDTLKAHGPCSSTRLSKLLHLQTGQPHDPHYLQRLLRAAASMGVLTVLHKPPQQIHSSPPSKPTKKTPQRTIGQQLCTISSPQIYASCRLPCADSAARGLGVQGEANGVMAAGDNINVPDAAATSNCGLASSTTCDSDTCCPSASGSARQYRLTACASALPSPQGPLQRLNDRQDSLGCGGSMPMRADSRYPSAQEGVTTQGGNVCAGTEEDVHAGREDAVFFGREDVGAELLVSQVDGTGSFRPPYDTADPTSNEGGEHGQEDDDVYSLNAISGVLCSDHPNTVRPMAPMFRDHMPAYQLIADCVRQGKQGYDLLHGRTCWDAMKACPDLAGRFNQSMTAVSNMGNTTAVLLDYPWHRHDHLIDVGGGVGGFMAPTLRKFPNLKGTLFDLPHVVDSARQIWAAQHPSLIPRMSFASGSFLQLPSATAIPPPPPNAIHTVYVLRNILHDWDDEACCTILRNIRAAMDKTTHTTGTSTCQPLLTAIQRNGLTNTGDGFSTEDVENIIVTDAECTAEVQVVARKDDAKGMEMATGGLDDTAGTAQTTDMEKATRLDDAAGTAQTTDMEMATGGLDDTAGTAQTTDMEMATGGLDDIAGTAQTTDMEKATRLNDAAGTAQTMDIEGMAAGAGGALRVDDSSTQQGGIRALTVGSAEGQDGKGGRSEAPRKGNWAGGAGSRVANSGASSKEVQQEATLVIVEMAVVPEVSETLTPRLLSDVHMMVMHGGKERSGKEFQHLLECSGFKLHKVHCTRSLFVVLEAKPV